MREQMKNLFGKQLEKELSINKEKIVNLIKKQHKSLTIGIRPKDIEDIIKKKKNPDYLNDKIIEYLDNGIILICEDSNFLSMIEDSISKDITQLSISLDLLKDISYLKNFPYLEKLIINDHKTLTKEELDYIQKNTNIKIIISNDHNLVEKNEEGKAQFTFLNSPTKACKYKDIIISSAKTSQYNTSTLFFVVNEVDCNSLKEIDNLCSVLKADNLTINKIIIDDNKTKDNNKT